MATATTSEKRRHTPGPWKLDGGVGKDDERYIWSDRDEAGKGYVGTLEICIAKVGGKRLRERPGRANTRGEVILADARLMAAAPRLLAALEGVYHLVCLHASTDEELAAMHEVGNAIRMATEGRA